MKKLVKVILNVLLYVAVAAVFTSIVLYVYHSNDFFRALFEGSQASTVPTGSDSSAAASGAAPGVNLALTARLSLYIFIFVMILQIFAFVTTLKVFAVMRRSTEPLTIRMKKLENADLFLDLPLYFGLFGTVSAFIVVSFNPQISRLIAYSSTLVGIIFSVVLRISLQYPAKQRLLDEIGDAELKRGEE